MHVHLGWKDTSEVPVAGGKDWAPDMGTLCQHRCLDTYSLGHICKQT